MERIAVVTPAGARIKEYLDNNMTNVEITTFVDIFDFYKRVMSSLFRADTLLIMDDGLVDTRYRAYSAVDGIIRLRELLGKDNNVEVDRVLFLNKDEYTENKKNMEFVRESKTIRPEVRIIIATYPEYRAVMVKQLLIQNSQVYEDPTNRYKYVIRKKRGENTSSNILKDQDTSKSVVLEHKTYNPDVDFQKKQLSSFVGNDLIESTIQGHEVIGQIGLDVEEVDNFHNQEVQLIAVVGESKSGTSVTSMILGASASLKAQTLLVDLNYTNLGLSYLVEKTLIDDEIHNIKLEDVLALPEGIIKLREDVFNKNSLHILTNSLPVKRKINHSQFGFMMSNIIRMLKPSYRYVIVDIPIDEAEYYSNIMAMADKVILCSPPYMNNIMSLLSKVSKSSLIKSPAFMSIEDNRFKDVILIRTKIFSRVNKEIKPVKIEVINRYSETILNAGLNIAGIYLYNPKSYLDTILFNSITNS